MLLEKTLVQLPNTRIQNNRAEYMTPKQKETEFMVPIGGGIYCGDGLDLTIQNSTLP